MTHWIRNSAGRALLIMALSGLFLPRAAAAQDDTSGGWSVGVAGELVSQYIWRGLELHNKPNLQPDVYVGNDNLTLGVWSSWALNGDYKEIDTYLSWDQDLGFGALTLTGTDYFYPGSEGDFGSFSNFGGVVDGEPTGAHTLELGAAFTPAAVPLTFMVGWNAYNDPDHALFAQVSSEVSLPFVDLDGDIGFLLNDSPYYYGTQAGHATDFTLRATRSIPLGAIEPYVSAAVTRSPLMDKTYWIFAIGF